MNVTSVSLLDRLKQPSPDDADWRRLEQMYVPLIRRWIGLVPGLGDEAADLTQDVLVVVLREIPRFERQREGSFRAWLRQVTVNRVRTHRKQQRRRPVVGLDPAEGFLEQLADPNGPLAQKWDREHDQQVFHRLLEIVRGDFSASTWTAFQKFGLEGRPAAQVAAELGLSENAVLQAKSRVLKRLRQEGGQLLD